jgi:hypothetical protein
MSVKSYETLGFAFNTGHLIKSPCKECTVRKNFLLLLETMRKHGKNSNQPVRIIVIEQ